MRTFARVPALLAAGVTVVALALSTVPAADASTAAVAGRKPPPNGSYAGHESPVEPISLDTARIYFRVAKHGTRLLKWRVEMNASCYNYPYSVMYVNQNMPTMKITKSGRFRSLLERTYNGLDARILVTGRFVGRQVKQGRLEYRVGYCRRTIGWTASPGR